MGKWLRKFISDMPDSQTDNVDIVTKSTLSVTKVGENSAKIYQFKNKEQKEEWEERAAIMEYDANLPRNIAEREAYNNVIQVSFRTPDNTAN